MPLEIILNVAAQKEMNRPAGDPRSENIVQSGNHLA
jgi:hypothetical protein